MTKEELLNPRYKVIADYPGSIHPVGTVLECPNFEHDFTKKYWCQGNDKYPHLFKKLNWWEHRKNEDMPKKVVSAIGPYEVYEIVKWDMDYLLGYIDIDKREVCDLALYHPEFGYFPVD